VKAILFGVCAALACVAGCSASGDSRAPCDAIAERCHAVDLGPGEIRDCHVNAEEVWTPAECREQRARCTTLCSGGPPPPPEDSGPPPVEDSGAAEDSGAPGP
jgi:hypothetical protein